MTQPVLRASAIEAPFRGCPRHAKPAGDDSPAASRLLEQPVAVGGFTALYEVKIAAVTAVSRTEPVPTMK
jgi:hypothetical protein